MSERVCGGGREAMGRETTGEGRGALLSKREATYECTLLVFQEFYTSSLNSMKKLRTPQNKPGTGNDYSFSLHLCNAFVFLLFFFWASGFFWRSSLISFVFHANVVWLLFGGAWYGFGGICVSVQCGRHLSIV